MIYDPFQQQAIDYIKDGFSVIVSAPTGAGKTVIAEYVLRDCLEKKLNAVYTAPIKALSNQKFRDFHSHFQDHIGILTGDVSINAEAPVLIMTTEIFHNKILDEPNSLKKYSWIIFDEVHYIDNPERGTVWEESLIFLPTHMKILALSATIPNIRQLAEWIESIHKKPIKIVIEQKRPVPLHFFFYCQNEIIDKVDNLKKLRKGRPNRLSALINYIRQKDGLPCIYFVFSRRKTEHYAEEMHSFDFLTPEEKTKIKVMFNELCERFDLVGDAGACRIRSFIERGIAYHHAGMLPTLKEVVERLFTSRLIKVIFTTETFALGINMPARSVILDELSKFYGFGHRLLKTRDFYQMAGRAGRRSIDTEGHVFCRINPHFLTPEELYRVVYGDTEKVLSQFNASYATILNLYCKYEEKLYEIYPYSLHHFQERKFARNKAVENLRAKVNFLKNTGFIQKNRLTDKGLFASKVYGYELLLSEFHICGLLERLSLRDLGLLILAVVFEPRKGLPKPPLPKYLRQLEQFTSDIVRAVHRAEKQHRIRPLTKRPFFHLSNAMDAWLKGESFEGILELTGVDEGEVVRYFRMTIQILRDIQHAQISDKLKSTIHQLIDGINRDVVDSEKQLRS